MVDIEMKTYSSAIIKELAIKQWRKIRSYGYSANKQQVKKKAIAEMIEEGILHTDLIEPLHMRGNCFACLACITCDDCPMKNHWPTIDGGFCEVCKDEKSAYLNYNTWKAAPILIDSFNKHWK